MSGEDPLLRRCDQWCAQLAAGDVRRSLSGETVTAGLAQGREFLAAGRQELAVRLLEALTARAGDQPSAWLLLGFAYREAQQMASALRAFEWSTQLDPRSLHAAMGLAQCCIEAGLPASERFAAALRLAPGDGRALCGLAAALAQEGRRDEAEHLMEQRVTQSPGWLEGHRSLATLRQTSGAGGEVARSYAAACQAEPRNQALWLAWFQLLVQRRDWPAADRMLAEAEAALGDSPALQIARLVVASESGDATRAAALFAATAGIRDEVRDLAEVRHLLRTGDPQGAEQRAEYYQRTRAARQFWPYLGLIWRLRGSARADWLEGAPPYVQSFDLPFAQGELVQLAQFLRGLHHAGAPFLGQSVRGGTQTDQQIFLRLDPPLQRLKAMVQDAVRDYVAALPPPDAQHPLLAPPRAAVLAGRVGFAGSWSVRLASQGYNVAHTHPLGWISSALYISLPSPEQMGAPPSGWIEFGTPPPELGLALEPYLRVQPVPGRLVLFPSTTWHSTVPFNEGERLVVAFDVRPPVA